MSQLAPVVTLEGWKTATIRHYLRLEKSKDKREQSPRSHAVDGIALACSQFISFERYQTKTSHGANWMGEVSVTHSVFKGIRRPPICRRQLHLLQPRKGGVRRKYGGTVTRHNGLRKGDFVKAEKAGFTMAGFRVIQRPRFQFPILIGND